MLINRLPVTFALATGSIIVSVSIALPAGYMSAVNQYSWKDHLSTIFAFLGLSIPNFFLAIILIQIFSVNLGWLPITSTDIFQGPITAIRILILPVIALGTALAAQTMRLLRSSMLEAFSEEYVRVARAKGLPQKMVNRYIVFKNALIPVITIVALQFGFLLGGTVVIEEVFALPGLGRLMLTSVSNRDLPVLQATLLFFTLVFITVNLIADLLYAYVDPRIKYGGEGQ
jgi:peptide/nickel transport system permease protein